MKLTGKITMLMMGLLCSCSHLSPPKNLLTDDYLLVKGSKQITFLGDNDHPRFSPDGTKLIYSSRSRSSHRGSQIYELDLLANKERRVTYSDGDAFDPVYITDGEILYASTTDEIKESPFLNKSFDKEIPPSELYMSDRLGVNILRMTEHPGFDGEAIFANHPTKPYILFNSLRDNTIGIYRMDLTQFSVSPLVASPDKERRDPTVSADQRQAAFIEIDKKTQEQSLVLYNIKSKKSEIIKHGEGLYRDLIFAPRAPNRLFYSILRKGDKQYQLESYNLEEKCTRVIFRGADSLTAPALSDDRDERLAFVRTFQDKKQIYIVSGAQLYGSPCLEAH